VEIRLLVLRVILHHPHVLLEGPGLLPRRGENAGEEVPRTGVPIVGGEGFPEGIPRLREAPLLHLDVPDFVEDVRFVAGVLEGLLVRLQRRVQLPLPVFEVPCEEVRVGAGLELGVHRGGVPAGGLPRGGKKKEGQGPHRGVGSHAFPR